MWLHHTEDHKTLIYEQPDTIPASYSVLNFDVDDIDHTVIALSERDVRFERYPDPRSGRPRRVQR